MTQIGFETRRAHPGDADAILVAHLDSIRSIGARFYPPETVEAWQAGLTLDVYMRAMDTGEAFFIAILGRGEALLMTGRSMPCVFMRKRLTPA